MLSFVLPRDFAKFAILIETLRCQLRASTWLRDPIFPLFPVIQLGTDYGYSDGSELFSFEFLRNQVSPNL